ncbi:MAG: hypothetical protein WB711_08600 [Terriglobales bacterium]
MNRATIRFSVLFCTVALAMAAFADDQEKATKEIKKITSISVDSNMRAIVNRTMADMLKTKRLDLVKERQENNLNYGDLFLAQQLVASGAKMEDIAAQLKAGKSIFDIANADHANWKQINSEAKKLNKKVDDNIEKSFTDAKKQAALNMAEDYDAKADKVPADSNITKDEYAEAQSRYTHLHDLATAELPTGDANVKGGGTGVMAPSASSH